MPDYDTFEHDVLIIGSGGAGLRAAIEASAAGVSVTVQPMKAFPLIKDLLTNVSWNFRVKKKIKPFKPRPPDAPDGTWRMQQEDIDRVQEFRKCIECFLCQDVCHVLRDHGMHEKFIGPRFLIHVAALEMHPLDTEDRIEELRNAYGIGYCNITKCCTKVCPESIEITDNGIIPLKNASWINFMIHWDGSGDG